MLLSLLDLLLLFSTHIASQLLQIKPTAHSHSHSHSHHPLLHHLLLLCLTCALLSYVVYIDTEGEGD